MAEAEGKLLSSAPTLIGLHGAREQRDVRYDVRSIPPLRSPHWAHLMWLILEMGSKDVHQALGYFREILHGCRRRKGAGCRLSIVCTRWLAIAIGVCLMPAPGTIDYVA
jgi:hypothetical protein